MPTEFHMPKLGLTMTEGTIIEWMVADGAPVRAGQAALRVETDKVETEIEAPAEGTLRHVGRVGDTFACGTLIAWVDAPGEPQAGSRPSPAGRSERRIAASPNARRLAESLGVDLASLRGSGPGGRIVAADVEAGATRTPAAPVAPLAPLAPAAPPAPASPLAPASPAHGATQFAPYAAAHLAQQLGLEVGDIAPSGPGTRLTRADVLRHARERLAVPASPAGAKAGATVPLTGIRGTIATRMRQSLAEMAQLTLTMDVAMDRALELRAQLAEIGVEELGAVPTITDLVIAATARALRAHPVFNSRVAGEHIELLDEIDIGIAVATERGLMVPVVRHADRMALPDLAVHTTDLVARARAATLTLDDLEGGTFAVTNLGGHGVDAFTPIINPPNTAILGVGRVRDDTDWDGDRPAKVRRMTLSLTWDHRVADGMPAAEFGRAVKRSLEQPLRLLAESAGATLHHD